MDEKNGHYPLLKAVLKTESETETFGVETAVSEHLSSGQDSHAGLITYGENILTGSDVTVGSQPENMDAETEALIREVGLRRVALFQPVYTARANQLRIQEWQHVADAVNRCQPAGIERSQNDVRRMWKSLKEAAMEQYKAFVDGKPTPNQPPYTAEVLDIVGLKMTASSNKSGRGKWQQRKKSAASADARASHTVPHDPSQENNSDEVHQSDLGRDRRKRPKKPDYTREEVEKLLEEVRKRRLALFSQNYSVKANRLRRLHWQRVTDLVNRCSFENVGIHRTMGEVISKWKRLKKAAVEEHKMQLEADQPQQHLDSGAAEAGQAGDAGESVQHSLTCTGISEGIQPSQTSRNAIEADEPTQTSMDDSGTSQHSLISRDASETLQPLPESRDARESTQQSQKSKDTAETSNPPPRHSHFTKKVMEIVRLCEEDKTTYPDGVVEESLDAEMDLIAKELESSSIQNQKKQRNAKKPNYTEAEVRALVREVRARRGPLFRLAHTANASRLKRLHWKHVADSVSKFTLRGIRRTPTEVQQKWKKLREAALEDQKSLLKATVDGNSPPKQSPFSVDVLEILEMTTATGGQDAEDSTVVPASLDCHPENQVDTTDTSSAQGTIDGNGGKRLKKANFSTGETEALLREVKLRRVALFKADYSAKATRVKRMHWQRVSDIVSQCRDIRRTPWEVRTKWKRLKEAAMEEQKAVRIAKENVTPLPKQTSFTKEVLEILHLQSSGIKTEMDRIIEAAEPAEDDPSERTGRIHRKPNFSKAETETLIREVARRKASLFGPVYTAKAKRMRHQQWQKVAESVSKSSRVGTQRSILEVRRKWKLLRSTALEEERKAAAMISGPNSISPFTMQVLDVLKTGPSSTAEPSTRSSGGLSSARMAKSNRDTLSCDGRAGPSGLPPSSVGSADTSQTVSMAVSQLLDSGDGTVNEGDENTTPGSQKPKRTRRANMTQEQVECLLNGVEEYQSLLLVNYPDDMFAEERRNAWKTIMDQVNSCEGEKWSVSEIRGSWKHKRSATVKHLERGETDFTYTPWYCKRVAKILQKFDSQITDPQNSTEAFSQDFADRTSQDDADNSFDSWGVLNTTSNGTSDMLSNIQTDSESRSEIEQHLRVMAQSCERLKVLGVDTKVLIVNNKSVLSSVSGVPSVMEKLSAASALPLTDTGARPVYNAEQPSGFSASDGHSQSDWDAHSSAASSQGGAESSAVNSVPAKPSDIFVQASVSTTAGGMGADFAESGVNQLPSGMGHDSIANDGCEFMEPPVISLGEDGYYGNQATGNQTGVESALPSDIQFGSRVTSGQSDQPVAKTSGFGPLHTGKRRPGRLGAIGSKSTTNEEQKLCCETCGKFFANKQSLSKHKQQNHLGQKVLYNCDMCDRTLTSRANLQRHRAKHLGLVTKDFQCEICGQGFTEKANLKCHMRIHTGERPFACEFCGKRFSVPGPLKYHLAQHTGHRPHVCEVCGKGFVEPARLRYHMQAHNGVKFQCDFCEKAYSRKDQLTLHRRIHTGDGVHTCEVCSKVFTKASKLRDHIRVHTGERPFRCEVCGDNFARSDALFLHKKKHNINMLQGIIHF